MPLFAYICKACGARNELLVRADEQQTACPSCGSTRMERQMSRFAPMSSQAPEPACSGCAMASDGRCPSQAGCMP